jgi:hypothetical protein
MWDPEQKTRIQEQKKKKQKKKPSHFLKFT